MEFETITIDRQDAVWLLTLDRQDRLNAMNQKMLSEIETACDVIEADSSCHVVILTGAGKAFTPGFDLQDQVRSGKLIFPCWVLPASAPAKKWCC